MQTACGNFELVWGRIWGTERRKNTSHQMRSHVLSTKASSVDCRSRGKFSDVS